ILQELVESVDDTKIYSRFDIYAPYVKSLDVYGRNSSSVGDLGWRVLTFRSQHRSLLPNLERLTIKARGNPDDGEQSLCIAAFASPSLAAVSIPRGSEVLAPIVSYKAAAYMMQLLTRHKPNITKLDLFPSLRARGYSEDAWLTVRQISPEEPLPFYKYIAGFTSLTHLSGSAVWLERNAFLVLSRLPCLESITIYVDRGDFRISSKLNSLLSDASFPSLQELALEKLAICQTAAVMSMERLVSRLTTLRLGIAEDRFELDDVYEYWRSDFSDLFRHTPHLHHFTLNLYEPETGTVQFDEMVLQPLVQLPLRSLVLHDISLEDAELAPKGVETIWPNLTELRMPDHLVPFHELWKFTTVPNLRHLEVLLCLRDPKKPNPTREVTPVKSLEVIRSDGG
ncbi:hypothetical protein FRC07_012620, partial [Ceratobasidium sp. 392]